MNRFKYKKYILYAFALFAIITYGANILYPKEVTVVQTIDKTQNYIQMYMLNNEYVIPVSFIPTSKDITEQMKEMMEYMNGNKQLEDFEPLFLSDTKIKNIKIENDSVYLNFEIMNYHMKNELKILESLAWSMTQFENCKEVKLFIDDKEIKVMPKGNTPIPEILNRKIGLNNFESVNKDLHISNSVLCYYTKKIRNEIYYVPVSVRIYGDDKKWHAFEKVSVSTNLKSILDERKVKILSVQEEKTKIKVNVNENILKNNKVADKISYETLVLSLMQLYPEKTVEIYVNDVLLNNKIEYNIVINQIKL